MPTLAQSQEFSLKNRNKDTEQRAHAVRETDFSQHKTLKGAVGKAELLPSTVPDNPTWLTGTGRKRQ